MMGTTTDNQSKQTAKTSRGQASKKRRHQKHKAKKAQHAATGQHGWRCEYNSTRCDDDDEKTAPQMLRGAGHTFLFAFWLSTHFAGVCRSFQEFSGVAIPPHIRLLRALRRPQTTRLRPNNCEKICTKIWQNHYARRTGTRTGPMQNSRQETITNSGEHKIERRFA